MTEMLWNPGRAGQIGNMQGQMTGYIAGLYSIPGMANIAAAPTEVLNQNGYTVYEDSETGRFNLVRDNYPDNRSIWNSQSMGVTMDCTGDTFSINGLGEEEDEQDGSGNAGKSGSVQSTMNSTGFYSPSCNFDYNTFTNSSRASFATSAQNTINRLSASQNAGISFASTAGLNNNETIDPITHAVVDKEKSTAVDELNMSEATKHKFDKISKLIYKVSEKQNKAEVKAKDKSGDYAIGGAALGYLGAGAVGAIAAGSAKTGAAIGSALAPGIGTIAGLVVGGAVGFAIGQFCKGSDEAKAEEINNEAIKEAKEAGEDLKESLEELSDEELIAFQRYYNEKYGCQLTDVLKSLETDEDSTEIAQGAGIDDGYLSDIFANIDDANAGLKPDETNETTSNNITTISYSEAAQIEVLQQNANTYRQYWLAAMQNGGSVELNGETKTADELSQLYIEANQQLENYMDQINPQDNNEPQMQY